MNQVFELMSPYLRYCPGRTRTAVCGGAPLHAQYMHMSQFACRFLSSPFKVLGQPSLGLKCDRALFLSTRQASVDGDKPHSSPGGDVIAASGLGF